MVEEEDKITKKELAFCCSGMGTLLYLTKHLRPDITNAVRKLLKSMDGASKLQLQELRRVAKFVLVEKPLFSIGLISSCADQFSSCALFQSGIACLHVSFTVYECLYKLSKSASFSRWLVHPVIPKNQ